jgi:hypothetical protein
MEGSLTSTARFLGTTLADDLASEALDIASALYAWQDDAAKNLQLLTDEQESIAYAEGRDDFGPADLPEMREHAAAMQAAVLAYHTTRNALEQQRRPVRRLAA